VKSEIVKGGKRGAGHRTQKHHESNIDTLEQERGEPQGKSGEKELRRKKEEPWEKKTPNDAPTFAT